MKNAIENVLISPTAFPSPSMTVPVTSRPQLTLKVPFAFTVGRQVLPPGQYHLEPQMGWESDRNVVVVCSTDGEIYHASCATNIPLASASHAGRVVFQGVGGQMYLSEIQAAHQRVLIRLDSGATSQDQGPKSLASRANQRLELELNSAHPTTSPAPLPVVSPRTPQL
ncbi:MAG TPA: hypothetical protein VKA02_01010 [Candidatus Acidoferrum sp.]|nr:hypothetical protein [Candidatus Acidoferrum sp.]